MFFLFFTSLFIGGFLSAFFSLTDSVLALISEVLVSFISVFLPNRGLINFSSFHSGPILGIKGFGILSRLSSAYIEVAEKNRINKIKIPLIFLISWYLRPPLLLFAQLLIFQLQHWLFE